MFLMTPLNELSMSSYIFKYFLYTSCILYITIMIHKVEFGIKAIKNILSDLRL